MMVRKPASSASLGLAGTAKGVLALLFALVPASCGAPAQTPGQPGTVSVRMGGEMGLFGGVLSRH